MKLLRRFFIRLANLATGSRADQRLQDELAEHLAFQTEENLRAGMPAAEARSVSPLRLSNPTSVISVSFKSRHRSRGNFAIHATPLSVIG